MSGPIAICLAWLYLSGRLSPLIAALDTNTPSTRGTKCGSIELTIVWRDGLTPYLRAVDACNVRLIKKLKGED